MSDNPKTMSVAILFVLFGLVGCADVDEAADESRSSEQGSSVQRVEVTLPEYRSFTETISITGTAEPNMQIMVHAMESGFVKKVNNDIGDVVKTGQVIAVLGNPDLFRQQKTLAPHVKDKKSTYERLKSTYEHTPAITPIQMVEHAEAEYLSLRAELDALADRISWLEVRAPFPGILTQRFVDVGSIVTSGIDNSDARALFELQMLDPIRLNIPLPESDASSVMKGTSATITFPDLPGEAYTATISRMANSLDLRSKTMRVEIDLPNKDGRIKPGMHAKVLLDLSSRDSVLSLPVTCQIMVKGQPAILVVENGTAKYVLIRKGLSNMEFFEVLDPEVTQNANVIILGKGLVQDGDDVEPVMSKK